MLLRYENQNVNQITCGNKASKDHRRMDTNYVHETISHAKPSGSQSNLVR